MTGGDASMKTGSASRYIKPSWLEQGFLSSEAFDLRDGSPPETYVSHFLVHDSEKSSAFVLAHSIISKKLKNCLSGSIAIIEIAEALEEVNDNRELMPFIDFVEKNLPHCGLVYLTTDQENIQEAKATLCVLAEKRISSVINITDSYSRSQFSLCKLERD